MSIPGCRERPCNLPKIQFTAWEISSGAMFLGYANEKSATNACLFIRVLLAHLKTCGIRSEGMKIQTDNGSEFIGCFRQDRSRDGFERIVESEVFKARHKRLASKAWSDNSEAD